MIDYSVPINMFVAAMTLWTLGYVLHRLGKAKDGISAGEHLAALMWVMGVIWLGLTGATALALSQGYL